MDRGAVEPQPREQSDKGALRTLGRDNQGVLRSPHGEPSNRRVFRSLRLELAIRGLLESLDMKLKAAEEPRLGAGDWGLCEGPGLGLEAANVPTSLGAADCGSSHEFVPGAGNQRTAEEPETGARGQAR
ncbi:hypothetical protein NDU88_002350 [Pleurodeles waltl]|uniref:Uncharacterized protein n=1 Tax=Pleurodeles waltl TaxID=8319 RepID=A0AAV7UYL5_PLEWA|nr:hypothetical protein NDU88_002350 [Pleurodeles waltl]